MSIKRSTSAIALGVLLGCASTKTPPPASTMSTAAVSADQRSEELLQALQNGRWADATAHFDENMKSALTDERIAGVMRQLTGEYGAMKSWTLAEKQSVQGFDVRKYDVTFEKGDLFAVISVRPTSEIGGLRFVPAPPKAAAVDPKAPFHAEMVTVGNKPFLLGGTITLPKEPGKYPAVVLVQGSGPQDRDETIGVNKPFRDLAEGLSAKGIVVLRYDKRTFSYGQQMDIQKITVDDEVITDAIAGVTLLKARPEVDPTNVYVVGHSLGAMLAPEIAHRAGPVAGVIMLAPASRPLPQVVVQQMKFLKTPKEQVEPVESAAKKLMAGKMKPDEEFFYAPASYWMDLLGRDEIGIARKLGVPMLLLRGDRDWQVTEEDLQGWQKGLAGTPKVTIETLPGLNHLFMRGAGKEGPEDYAVAGHVEPAVIDRIAAFVATVPSPRRNGPE